MTTADQIRRKLLPRIQRRYRVLSEGLNVGPLRLWFTRVADPDRVLDDVAAEADRIERVSGRRADGDQLHLPYWAELWDSATGVGAHLAEVWPKRFASRSGSSETRVLDLGCGMGLAGAVAAALGGRVLFADLETSPLLFARLNSAPWAHRVRTRRLDWQTARLDEQFDLILGSDILYERPQWDSLEPFWRAHLAPSGCILLGEPGRQTGDLFLQWIQDRGWTLRLTEQAAPNRPRPIRVLELRLRALAESSR